MIIYTVLVSLFSILDSLNQYMYSKNIQPYGFIGNLISCFIFVCIYKILKLCRYQRLLNIIANIGSVAAILASISGLQEIYKILKDSHSIWLILSLSILLSLVIYLTVKVIYSVKNIIK